MFDGSLDDIPDEYRLTGGGEELENNGKIVVVVVEPGKEPRIEEIDSGLESLQGICKRLLITLIKCRNRPLMR